MARTIFIPPGPSPVPYRLADLAERTHPDPTQSAELASVIVPEAPGRRRRSVDIQSPTVPKRTDKAARRERASANVERAVSAMGRTVEYGRDTRDARLRERLVSAGVAPADASAVDYLDPRDVALVTAAAVSGRANKVTRRILRRARLLMDAARGNF